MNAFAPSSIYVRDQALYEKKKQDLIQNGISHLHVISVRWIIFFASFLLYDALNIKGF